MLKEPGEFVYHIFAEWETERDFINWVEDPSHAQQSGPLARWLSVSFARKVFEIRYRPPQHQRTPGHRGIQCSAALVGDPGSLTCRRFGGPSIVANPNDNPNANANANGGASGEAEAGITAGPGPTTVPNAGPSTGVVGAANREPPSARSSPRVQNSRCWWSAAVPLA